MHAPSPAEKTYEIMKDLLKKGEAVPDAILLPHSSLRAAIVRALEEHGLKVPRDVSLVTAEALHGPEGHTSEGHATVILEPALPLSRLLMEMLFARIQQKGNPVPGRWFPSKILCGNTTRPEENRLFERAGGSNK